MEKRGDLLDKWTILVQKAKFDEVARRELGLVEEEIAGMIRNELLFLLGAKEGRPPGMLSVAFLRSLVLLAIANGKSWENEAAIRKEYPGDLAAMQELSLAEIGRRAIIIREHNKDRVEAKNAISTMFGQLPDNKVDHTSGGKP
jgi:hypothetical protein